LQAQEAKTKAAAPTKIRVPDEIQVIDCSRYVYFFDANPFLGSAFYFRSSDPNIEVVRSRAVPFEYDSTRADPHLHTVP
jgi:hypothetical protein